MKTTPEQKKKTFVLLIEDDLDEFRNLDQSLKSQNFQTIPCSTPAEALQHVEREEVGIAVLGLCLPKATNIHLMKQLQRNHEPLQIIVYAKPESRSSPKAAINAGAFAYLKKS